MRNLIKSSFFAMLVVSALTVVAQAGIAAAEDCPSTYAYTTSDGVRHVCAIAGKFNNYCLYRCYSVAPPAE